MFDSEEAFVGALRSRFESSLIAVADGRREEYDLLFSREDVEGRFRPEDFDRIHDGSLLRRDAREDAENVFRAGSLDFAIYTFDEAVVIQFLHGEGSLFVAFEDGDVPLLQAVELCSEWVRSDV
ncbi:hypothetical protein [Haladaptatus sp. DYF46]|uniref:hypothetical protein n=1 Tax=unclassified Haladaptatus TaxID=2622732 RepID=UPI001E57F588|nr:hypothetical protein [Haladaptatus sp. DYF46]